MILWIASYPKSGNTWLRALLSSYYFSKDGSFNQEFLKMIDQFPQKSYFKDFDYDPTKTTDTSKFWIKAQEKINNDKKIKFFKTHNILGSINNNNFTNKKNTIGAIYVVRDPRNIVTSLQNHYEISKDEALNFMLNKNKFIYDYYKENDYSDFQFISSWEKNYQSWINQKVFPVKIIKYEDLNSKTYDTLKKVIEYVNKISGNKIKFDYLRAKNSIQSTSFEKLKKIEKIDGFSESVLSKNYSKKIPFFLLGPKNDWKKIFDENFKRKLNLIFNDNLNELNYN